MRKEIEDGRGQQEGVISEKGNQERLSEAVISKQNCEWRDPWESRAVL